MASGLGEVNAGEPDVVLEDFSKQSLAPTGPLRKKVNLQRLVQAKGKRQSRTSPPAGKNGGGSSSSATVRDATPRKGGGGAAPLYTARTYPTLSTTPVISRGRRKSPPTMSGSTPNFTPYQQTRRTTAAGSGEAKKQAAPSPIPPRSQRSGGGAGADGENPAGGTHRTPPSKHHPSIQSPLLISFLNRLSISNSPADKKKYNEVLAGIKQWNLSSKDGVTPGGAAAMINELAKMHLVDIPTGEPPQDDSGEENGTGESGSQSHRNHQLTATKEIKSEEHPGPFKFKGSQDVPVKSSKKKRSGKKRAKSRSPPSEQSGAFNPTIAAATFTSSPGVFPATASVFPATVSFKYPIKTANVSLKGLKASQAPRHPPAAVAGQPTPPGRAHNEIMGGGGGGPGVKPRGPGGGPKRGHGGGGGQPQG